MSHIVTFQADAE